MHASTTCILQQTCKQKGCNQPLHKQAGTRSSPRTRPRPHAPTNLYKYKKNAHAMHLVLQRTCKHTGHTCQLQHSALAAANCMQASIQPMHPTRPNNPNHTNQPTNQPTNSTTHSTKHLHCSCHSQWMAISYNRPYIRPYNTTHNYNIRTSRQCHTRINALLSSCKLHIPQHTGDSS
jgi:hypothetical protein